MLMIKNWGARIEIDIEAEQKKFLIRRGGGGRREPKTRGRRIQNSIEPKCKERV